MGYKNICFDCRKAFNQGTDYNDIRNAKCPDCGKMMKQISQRFRPPKKNEIKKWEVAKLLIENGFVYQSIFENIDGGIHIKYPENMIDAKEFIIKYKDQAITD